MLCVCAQVCANVHTHVAVEASRKHQGSSSLAVHLLSGTVFPSDPGHHLGLLASQPQGFFLSLSPRHWPYRCVLSPMGAGESKLSLHMLYWLNCPRPVRFLSYLAAVVQEEQLRSQCS